MVDSENRDQQLSEPAFVVGTKALLNQEVVVKYQGNEVARGTLTQVSRYPDGTWYATVTFVDAGGSKKIPSFILSANPEYTFERAG